MTSEGRKKGLGYEGGGGLSILTIIGSAGVGPSFRFFGCDLLFPYSRQSNPSAPKSTHRSKRWTHR